MKDNPEERAAEDAKIPTREEFTATYFGLDKGEVTSKRGKPERTEVVGGRTAWMYHYVAKDAATGKREFSTTLWFNSAGVVSEITY